MFPLVMPPVTPHVPSSPHYSRWKSSLPYRAKWGKYMVVVKNISGDPHDKGEPEHVLILNGSGRVLREIRGHFFTEVNIVTLLNKKPGELHLAHWTGGANSSFSDAYFTLTGGLHNLIVGSWGSPQSFGVEVPSPQNFQSTRFFTA